MIELVRTNDLVAISLMESLFRDAGIACLVLDQHMSVLEGSIGILPRRLMVADDEKEKARRLLVDAGLADFLKEDGRSGTRNKDVV
ncbi:DUF2007 domain-containing protein [Salaquimonas pukyongi]|uniref:putative signal transducing protein n=1 Tax=Salaquimonas pukyongi TaxID=2712698 RepID=UPI00096B8150|nr:DUF2007 domain-containing protein [Salaquimonas pukyongi]